jgi:hypothetical protein
VQQFSFGCEKAVGTDQSNFTGIRKKISLVTQKGKPIPYWCSNSSRRERSGAPFDQKPSFPL